MKNLREKEYQEIFIAEAREEFDSLNLHLVTLEKSPTDEKTINEIFRLLHNMKANSKAIGYVKISELAHLLESVISAIRSKQLTFKGKIITLVFDAIDVLGKMLIDPEKSEDVIIDEKLKANFGNLLNNNSEEVIEIDDKLRYHTAQNIALSELIYIPIKKLDNLLNLVGELIIDKDRVVSLSTQLEHEVLQAISLHLSRISTELQHAVMDARLVSIGSLFNKFPRVVRDIALIESKQVRLHIEGQNIQIDRNILQVLTDSLLHIVRNAITHGIETPADRKKSKKPQEGQINMIAKNERDTVLIKISDDGKGINVEKLRQYAVEKRYVSADKVNEMRDKDLFNFIFEPGFSLSEQLTEIAGRGVGLDVVKNAIDALGGHVTVESIKGQGTTFNLYVPTSIAVRGALLFEVNDNIYAIPLIHTDSVVVIPSKSIHEIGSSMVADIKGETISLYRLSTIFDTHNEIERTGIKNDFEDIIIVSYNNRKVGLIVDKMLRQQDIVIKPLQLPMTESGLFGGVTLLGNGEVCLVLDVPSVARRFINVKEDFAYLT